MKIDKVTGNKNGINLKYSTGPSESLTLDEAYQLADKIRVGIEQCVDIRSAELAAIQEAKKQQSKKNPAKLSALHRGSIKRRYELGEKVDKLAKEYGLNPEDIRLIVGKTKQKPYTDPLIVNRPSNVDAEIH
jgi:hypothetical protein